MGLTCGFDGWLGWGGALRSRLEQMKNVLQGTPSSVGGHLAIDPSLDR